MVRSHHLHAWMLLGTIGMVPACIGQPDTVTSGSLIELRIAHAEQAVGLDRVDFEGDPLYVEPESVIADPDLTTVRPHRRGDQLILDMELESSAVQRLNAALRQAAGGRLVVMINSEVRAAPIIVGTEVGPRVQSALTVGPADADRITQGILTRWPVR
jgi:hypothetical protein